jgi:hypothetical protein
MSLRKPLRTPALLTVNHAEALKSTGPRAVEDASDSTLNTLDQGIYSLQLYEAMVDLEEDPSQYQRLFRRTGEIPSSQERGAADAGGRHRLAALAAAAQSARTGRPASW